MALTSIGSSTGGAGMYGLQQWVQQRYLAAYLYCYSCRAGPAFDWRDTAILAVARRRAHKTSSEALTRAGVLRLLPPGYAIFCLQRCCTPIERATGCALVYSSVTSCLISVAAIACELRAIVACVWCVLGRRV